MGAELSVPGETAPQPMEPASSKILMGSMFGLFKEWQKKVSKTRLEQMTKVWSW